MSRTPRIRVEGALYYVTASSAADAPLFCDQRDYQTYLRYLKEYQARYGFKLYAFLLLPHQLELCLEPMNSVTISTIIHALNSRYTKYATKRHGRSGHLFQGRFRSTLLELETMLLPVTGFLHRYPQLQKLVDSVHMYQWSSLPAYIDSGRYDAMYCPHVEAAEVLQRLAEERPGVDYGAYLESISEEECRRLEGSLHQVAAGSETFLELIRQYQNGPSMSVEPVGRTPSHHAAHAHRWRAMEMAGRVAVAVVVMGAVGLYAERWSALSHQPRAVVMEKEDPVTLEHERVVKASAVPRGMLAGPMYLNGTAWNVQIKPVDAASVSDDAQSRVDQLRFFDGRKVVSLRLSEEGFGWSNYTLFDQSDGTVRWETMQTGPGGETVCWSGEAGGETMRGIMTRQLPGGATENFTFVGAPRHGHLSSQTSNDI